jgi:hypothetical protein
MSPEDALAFEARWRMRAAVLTGVAAVLILVGGAASALVQSELKVTELTTALLFYHSHSSELLLTTTISGLGVIAMLGPLLFLYRATKARREQLPGIAQITAWFGPIAAGVGPIALQIVFIAKSNTFATSGAQTYAEAKHLTDTGLIKGLQGLLLAGQLSLGFAFVLIGLNAMRVGLLTRFMGVLAIISGVLFVIPLGGSLQVVQPFWLGALAALFLGRWPNGVPPAWETGKAQPWPTQQEMREAREKDTATRRGEPEPEPELEPEPEPAGAAAGQGRAHVSSKKRKRKRRR